MNSPIQVANSEPERAHKLTRSWLKQAAAPPPNVICGVPDEFPEKVVQFGEGNFLRAFADWMIDVLNEAGLFGGRIVVIQPIRKGLASVLNEQDGLYTLLMRGVQNGKVQDQRRIVTAISRALNPYDSWAEVMRCFRSPELRFVISNTTEAGIARADEPYRPAECPDSFPAKVTALLHERFQSLRGDPDRGLVFLPCELIERNGDKLREIVLHHIQQWNLGRDFADWVTCRNHFLNTLVDRIVPGYPREEAGQITRELGYEDSLIDAAELFHLWVIEGPKQLAEELPFHRTGLNVVWTNDLTPYRTRKVYILNGAHTSSVLAAFHGGLNTVQEMVEDPLFGRFVRRAVFDEIVPFVPLNKQECLDYANSVLERFHNPFIRHELLSISLNSVSKWKVRVLPLVLDYVRSRGALPPLLNFSLATLIHFYRGEPKAATELTGRRDGQSYSIRDDAAVIDCFSQCWGAYDRHHSFNTLAAAIFAQKNMWDMDLNTISGFADAVANDLQAIEQKGIRLAVEKLLS